MKKKTTKLPTTARGVLTATLALMQKYGEKQWIKGDEFQSNNDDGKIDTSDPLVCSKTTRLCYCLGGAAALAAGVHEATTRNGEPVADEVGGEDEYTAFNKAALLFGKANGIKRLPKFVKTANYDSEDYLDQVVFGDGYEAGMNVFADFNDRKSTTFPAIIKALKKAIAHKEAA